MKTRSILLTTLLALMMGFIFVSCDDDDDDEPFVEPELFGYYLLSSGNKGNNNATLSFCDLNGNVTSDYFLKKNGRKLGDTAQDIIIYGSKMYIAMYGSYTIEVTDLDGKSLKQVKSNDENAPLQPRALVTDNGYVYASLMDGYVMRMDTTTFEYQKIAVGRNPEQMAISGTKLYVANSGGLDYNTPMGRDKTVSVIDLNSFTETKKIEVALNPCNMTVDSNGDIYLISMGDYNPGGVPNTLQKIEKNTDKVSVLGNMTEMAMLNDKLYLLYSQYDANWNQTITYHTYTKGAFSDSFITDGTKIEKPYKICSDVKTSTIIVTESDYKNNGDAYFFNEAGKLQQKVETGLNPIKVISAAR